MTPKFNHDRFLILRALNPGKGDREYPLSHRELKRRALFESKPKKFKGNIRAMAILGWITKKIAANEASSLSTQNDDLYRITPRGKEVLSKWWAENYQEGKQEKLL